MNNQYTKELYHHGIIGMHWGERHGPPYPLDAKISAKIRKDDYGLRNLKRAKTANLDKWGKTRDNNVLYVVGYSGSGKSTTANRLAKPNDTVIHLDAYSEPDSGGAATIRSRKFNAYLDKKVPKWKEMANAQKDGSTKMIRHSKEYWDTVDTFREALLEYSKEEFDKGNRVIAEGVQMADDWLTADKNWYANKPIVTLTTSAIKSIKRAFERDDRGGLLKGLKNLDNAKEYLTWYKYTNKRLKDLSNVTRAKKKQDYLDTFIAEYAHVPVSQL